MMTAEKRSQAAQALVRWFDSQRIHDAKDIIAILIGLISTFILTYAGGKADRIEGVEAVYADMMHIMETED